MQCACVQRGPDRLISQDLQTPDVPVSQPEDWSVCKKRLLSGTTERHAVAGHFSPPFSNSEVEQIIGVSY